MDSNIREWIIRESDSWLAVNKPPGISVERQPGATDTLEDQLIAYLSLQKRRPFLGVIHRLDRPTSGILLLAKKKSALTAFHALFRTGKIRKTYLAVTANLPESAKGELQHWILKDPALKKALVVAPNSPGAVFAHLKYRILAKKPHATLWEIQLLTGKFHQIRTQLSAIGCPITGDALYGGEGSSEGLPFIALHAWRLSFFDPDSGSLQQIQAPLPDHQTWKAWEIIT